MNTRALSIISLCVCAGLSHGALNLTPGTLIATCSNNGVLRQVDPLNGSVLSSVQMQYANGSLVSGALGVAISGAGVFVAADDWFGSVDPVTGIFTPIRVDFSEYLGTRQNNFLVGAPDVREWDAQGNEVGNTQLNTEGVILNVIDIKDVGWAGNRFALLHDQQDFTPNDFAIFTFNTQGVVTGNEAYYARAQNYFAQGFDLDLANDQRWVAMSRFDNFNSKLALYQRGNVTALRTFNITFGALSDVAYIPVPSPGTLAITSTLVLFAAKRRR